MCIILGIKSIRTIDKVDDLVDDVNNKVKSLNGFFSIIDYTTDRIVSLTDGIVDGIVSFGSKIFKKRREKKRRKLEEELYEMEGDEKDE